MRGKRKRSNGDPGVQNGLRYFECTSEDASISALGMFKMAFLILAIISSREVGLVAKTISLILPQR